MPWFFEPVSKLIFCACSSLRKAGSTGQIHPLPLLRQPSFVKSPVNFLKQRCQVTNGLVHIREIRG